MSTSTSGSVATVEPTKVDMKTFLVRALVVFTDTGEASTNNHSGCHLGRFRYSCNLHGPANIL